MLRTGVMDNTRMYLKRTCTLEDVLRGSSSNEEMNAHALVFVVSSSVYLSAHTQVLASFKVTS